MLTVTDILPDSIAEELKIQTGSVLLTINGEAIEDIFDYRFLIEEEYVKLEIKNPSGEIDIYEIEKDLDEEMGLEFDNGMLGEYRRCSNSCIFCFIDQMPGGMRDTLYFKDDDSRLSFMQGNYITLTNMKDKDIDRIIRYNMSPINISVHTTDPQLRCTMLNNRFAGEKLKYIDRLFEAGCRMNAQIVLCRGINDGEMLRKTISDLGRYAPVMQSLSVVPVGLTKYREGLYPLEPVTEEDASAVIDMVEEFQKQFMNEKGIHFVHASDEFYLLAGRPLPEEDRYDGYLQIENGVGMLRLLREEFTAALKEFTGALEQEDVPSGPADRKITIATGKLAYDTLKELIQTARDRLAEAGVAGILPEVKCRVIRNDFFGERITVSGLICGRDIIDQLKGQELGQELLLPINMMRSGEEYFLDDVTVKQLEKELNVKAVIVPADGESLLMALMGREIETGGRQIYEQTDCCHSGQA
ncbi:MAG: DUF512 domain-containing protein [Parasporobacterium sp.]|nr:DUF512 domain-containing protein [Parasporobacterium sp.]